MSCRKLHRVGQYAKQVACHMTDFFATVLFLGEAHRLRDLSVDVPLRSVCDKVQKPRLILGCTMSKLIFVSRSAVANIIESRGLILCVLSAMFVETQ